MGALGIRFDHQSPNKQLGNDSLAVAMMMMNDHKAKMEFGRGCLSCHLSHRELKRRPSKARFGAALGGNSGLAEEGSSKWTAATGELPLQVSRWLLPPFCVLHS